MSSIGKTHANTKAASRCHGRRAADTARRPFAAVCGKFELRGGGKRHLDRAYSALTAGAKPTAVSEVCCKLLGRLGKYGRGDRI